MASTGAVGVQRERRYQVVGLHYVSLYMYDLDAAIAFYSAIFGPPESVDPEGMNYGWRMGSTWLTILPSSIGTAPESNPCNTEFAIQVSTAEEVDRLYQALVAAGAREFMAPADTTMYEPMRFACVDDPFGVRIDVYAVI
jgi:catechol 2,3-dioxygenase-like lactoylglutathione lyase family enzyme